MLAFVQGNDDVGDAFTADASAMFQGVVGGAIVWTVAVSLLLHILAGFTAWWTADKILTTKPVSDEQYLNGCFLMSLVCVYWLFFANAALYPNSWYARLPIFSGEQTNALIALALTVILVVLLLIGGALTVKDLVWRRRPKWAAMGYAVVGLFAIALITQGSKSTSYASQNAAPRADPDVIIIGIDSLWLNRLLTAPDSELTPVLNKLIAGSAVFQHAYTPLAQTFPAWISILSGRYPANHGIRANLLNPRRLTQDTALLSTQLSAQGYETIYATDEKLFSNIDESFGFDKVVGARMGAADFLINYFNDIPLHNLLVNSWAGRILFPYSYLNRAAYHTYIPGLFAREINANVKQINPTSPLFLAAHFCLPHWPYVWSKRLEEPLSLDDPIEIYQYTMAALDRQIGDLLAGLSEVGRLSNAVVILLSDHGEQYQRITIDAWTNPISPESAQLKAVSGHGAHLMSDQQNQVLMAFASIGRGNIEPAIHSRPVTSIVDVAPTLIDLAGLSGRIEMPVDGVSLAGVIRSGQATLKARAIFMETGFWLPGLSLTDANKLNETRRGAAFYRINGNGRLIFNDDAYNFLLATKQFSAIYAETQVILTAEQGTQQLFFRTLEGSGDAVRAPEQKDLQSAIRGLCKHFAGDLTIDMAQFCRAQKEQYDLARNASVN